MSHERTVLEALREANPVPDARDRYERSDDERTLNLLVQQRRQRMTVPTRESLRTSLAPQPDRPGRRRVALAFSTAVVLTIASIGAAVVLLRGGPRLDRASDEAIVTRPDISLESPVVDGGPAGITLTRIESPPEMQVLYDLGTNGDGWAIAAGDTGTFASADGLTWSPVDGASVGPDRVLPSTGDLPLVIETHPAITLVYRVDGVVEGPVGTVAHGHAQSTVQPTAVEEAYPDLGRVIDVTRTPPCDAAGEPLPCDLPNDDALWVRTAADPAYDAWQPVSLSGMGLTKEDVWRAYRLIWFSEDGMTFEPVVEREMAGPGEVEGIVATTDEFLMIDDGIWASSDGRLWRPQPPPTYQVSDLFMQGPRVLGSTSTDQIVEYHGNGSWTLLADPAPLRAPQLSHVGIEAIGDDAFGAVGYRDVLFVDVVRDEPLPTASFIALSLDGITWSELSLETTMGSTGSVEIAIVGDRLVLAFSPNVPEHDSAGFYSVPNPQWWTATITR